MSPQTIRTQQGHIWLNVQLTKPLTEVVGKINGEWVDVARNGRLEQK